MPALQVAVDDAVVATVNTAGMAMVHLSITAMRTLQARATIDLGGLPAGPCSPAAPSAPGTSLYYLS